MNIILKHNDINIKDLTIKKQINISDEFTNYPIKYNNYNLIIQTPIVFLPFGINKFNNKSYIDFSFINSKNDKTMKEFKTKIININNHLKNKFSSKRKFISNFKSTEYYPDRLRLSFSDDILIFNEAKALITHDHIKSKIYVKLLISPQFLWLTHGNNIDSYGCHDKYGTYGIRWCILQMKIYSKPILQTYSFIEDEVNIDKYIKMMRCGVPKQAVKNKMALEKIDPTLLDKFIPKTEDSQDSPNNKPKPLITLPLNIQLKKTGDKAKDKDKDNEEAKREAQPQKQEVKSNGFRMTLDILKNIKLKKVTEKRVPPPFTHMNPFINIDELQDIKRKILNE